jgi:hypothetical protein
MSQKVCPKIKTLLENMPQKAIKAKKENLLIQTKSREFNMHYLRLSIIHGWPMHLKHHLIIVTQVACKIN